jgi:GGDEF domain-containing protein
VKFRTTTPHELEYDELFDPATRLVRPALLVDRLDVALARAARQRRLVGVLFVRVGVPDDVASTAGDSFDLLPLMAGRLRSAVRPDDTVGRVGEHEFVVVCNGLTAPADIDEIADRLRSVMSVRVFLDESKSVLTTEVRTTAATPRDTARDVLDAIIDG